ncbi:Uncharacterized protein YR821_0927 [Yersinia ruckeri]|uniref:Uncharacterized protein n=1 Tax=Yersinia ruckeri TaxID=29486 RepID=A0A0A8VB59_YERRU|nr:hypothetical protein yruck0001_22320 [Yersinia ruckeri ATCC 29473]QTD75858.1 Uncharacterized protein YR821_0927 [Yersinia ruckeri]CEK26755.1 hypothetical protein CSF007_4935 [Yersinia ruckeri]
MLDLDFILSTLFLIIDCCYLLSIFGGKDENVLGSGKNSQIG